jgi:hypothetical protein
MPKKLLKMEVNKCFFDLLNVLPTFENVLHVDLAMMIK